MPLADSPARRVLGNKTTNASIKSQKSVKTWNNPTSSRDSLSISFGEITRSPKPSVNFKGPRVGQKRRIEEVEDHERNESQQSTDTQRLSQATDFLSDGSSFPNEMMVDSVSNSKSTAQTSLTSFHASQTEPDAAEAEFEIHEEMSQRTLDKMVCCFQTLQAADMLTVSSPARDLIATKHFTAGRPSTPQSAERNLTTQRQHVKSD